MSEFCVPGPPLPSTFGGLTPLVGSGELRPPPVRVPPFRGFQFPPDAPTMAGWHLRARGAMPSPLADSLALKPCCPHRETRDAVPQTS